MKKIKVKFIGFWSGFEKNNNIFIDILNKEWDVEVCSIFQKTDICFRSLFLRKEEKLFMSIVTSANLTVIYSGENILPKVKEGELLLSALDLDFENHIYFPNWMHTVSWELKSDIKPRLEMRRFGRPIIPSELNNVFNYKNKIPPEPILSALFKNRDEIRLLTLKKLGKYSKVIDVGSTEKLYKKEDLLKKSTYNMCFENSIGIGYVTEKLLEAKVTGNIPIYYGASLSENLYNENCCINLFENSFDIEPIFYDVHLIRNVIESPFLKVNANLFYEDKVQIINNWIKERLE